MLTEVQKHARQIVDDQIANREINRKDRKTAIASTEKWLQQYNERIRREPNHAHD